MSNQNNCRIIKKYVENHFKIGDISIKSRSREIALARQIYFHLCRKLTTSSFALMGSEVDRDHSTAIHGVKKIEDCLSLGIYAEISEPYNALSSKLKSIIWEGDADRLKGMSKSEYMSRFIQQGQKYRLIIAKYREENRMLKRKLETSGILKFKSNE